MSRKKLSSDRDYLDSLKSLDTEEGIDLAFYRPIGYFWARIARRLHITPNAITISSIFIGIAAGVAFYPANLWINLGGFLLLVLANSFDSADGQLARLTRQYSRIGRILDGLSGDFWFAAIYISICLRTNHTVGWFSHYPWAIWAVAVAAGICHAKQAALADYYRQFHLYFLKGASGSELDTCDDLRLQLRALPWKGNFWRKITLLFYSNYTANQEVTTRSMQALRAELHRRYPDGEIPKDFRRRFRRLSLPLMKWTNALTFNWRTITLLVCLLIGRPWIYFIAELTIFNAMLIYMRCRHESICRRLTHELRESSIRGVIFDYGGTLDTGGTHWSHVIADAYAKSGLNVDSDTFRHAYVEAEREMEHEPIVKPTDTFREVMLKKIRLELKHIEGTDPALAEPIAEKCYNYARSCVESSRPVLSELSGSCRLALVSNFYGNIRSVLANFGIARFFEVVIDSTEVGVRKPSPEIFRIALEAMELRPEQTIVVGDSIKNDILPAASLGCRTVLVDGRGWDGTLSSEDPRLPADTTVITNI
ncbi:MAG: HAD-IA family hydrolase, partial [Paramuribaculum sp.]|nr:HAD-IA family hydrolase [Paramuribaculum sp.]